MNFKKSKMPSLNGSEISVKRQELKTYFLSSRQAYESLFSCIVCDEAYYIRAEPLRHPLIFYYGHTATFFINKLRLGNFIEARINPSFESLFAVGVDEMSWDDLNTEQRHWPSVAEVTEYRKAVDTLVLQLIETMDLKLPITPESLAYLILMGIEHEHIHLETSSVIIRQLPIECVRDSQDWSTCTDMGEASTNELISVSPQSIVLGRSDADFYGWDNEFGHLSVEVDSFNAAQYLVSNAEYLAFIKADGYELERYWSTEGFQWLQYSQAKMPRFWRYHQSTIWQRNLLNEMPLPLNWPVEVNYHEAEAFCKWKTEQEHTNYRLPSESEWMVLYNQAEDKDRVHEANLNLEYDASSCPVNRFRQGQFFDVAGNVWQWTQSPMTVFPGFTVHPLYDDFTIPTLDNQHYQIKGGSWISCGNLASSGARYAFRKHFYQHAGFRYVQAPDLIHAQKEQNVYESDLLTGQYLELHYGKEYFGVSNYPQSCIIACKKYFPEQPTYRALDLGCSVGRSAFELACYFEQVDALDFSARFIEKGIKLQQHDVVRYSLPTEGDLVEYKEISLPEALREYSHKVHFMQADACNLKAQFKNYKLIFASNLIDRLYEPKRFLQDLKHRLLPQGLLVLTSPYTWLEQFTKKEHWLGARSIDGENKYTFETLKDILIEDFILLECLDIPFVIRETARKFQHSVAQMTIWRLK